MKNKIRLLEVASAFAGLAPITVDEVHAAIRVKWAKSKARVANEKRKLK